LKNLTLLKITLLAVLPFALFFVFEYNKEAGIEKYVREEASIATSTIVTPEPPHVLDKEAYDKKMLELANNPPVRIATSTTASTTTSTSTPPRPKTLWPAKTVYPNYGALLPFNRIVAYYGNYFSKQMGVLGEYPEDVMLQKLATEVVKWQQADPSTPVIPAIHYIATTAQRLPQADNSYMLRMPFSQIDKTLDLAEKAHGIVFLDIQTGAGSPVNEVLLLQKYLKLPQVHLGIDPEFAMKNGSKPGTVVGTIDASEINQVVQLLAKIVHENNLPPKILVIHRFTQKMVTNYQAIHPLPEVQIVMDMDGWGPQDLKKQTYQTVIYNEPVQFTGFKIFYKNDSKKASSTLFAPQQLLKLRPIPSYIQYQ
jgi:hypothetical protein